MRTPSLGQTGLILLALLSLAGCTAPRSTPPATAEPRTEHSASPQQPAMPPVILPGKISAVGFGALPTQEGLSSEQRRLLAMRASKLDAYRSLAETIAGLKLTGNSSVSAVTMNNDSFRVYVEAYLRGARVQTITPLPGGSYETVLELQLGGEFYRDAGIAAQGQPVIPPAQPAPATQKTRSEPEHPIVKPLATPASGVASANFYLAQ